MILLCVFGIMLDGGDIVVSERDMVFSKIFIKERFVEVEVGMDNFFGLEDLIRERVGDIFEKVGWC